MSPCFAMFDLASSSSHEFLCSQYFRPSFAILGCWKFYTLCPFLDKQYWVGRSILVYIKHSGELRLFQGPYAHPSFAITLHIMSLLIVKEAIMLTFFVHKSTTLNMRAHVSWRNVGRQALFRMSNGTRKVPCALYMKHWEFLRLHPPVVNGCVDALKHHPPTNSHVYGINQAINKNPWIYIPLQVLCVCSGWRYCAKMSVLVCKESSQQWSDPGASTWLPPPSSFLQFVVLHFT